MPDLNLTLLSAYVLAILTLLLTPGPVVMLITGTAAAAGAPRAFLTTLGANLASLALIGLAVLMLTGVVSLERSWLSLPGIAGSLYIGWGAVRTLRGLRQNPSSERCYSARVIGGFWQGVITGIANPKDILFFVAFFPQFIGISHHFTTSIVMLSVVWIVFDFLVMAGYIFAVKRLLPVTRNALFTGITALFMLVIAAGGLVWNVSELQVLFIHSA